LSWFQRFPPTKKKNCGSAVTGSVGKMQGSAQKQARLSYFEWCQWCC
jgi:hypothetical protein